MPARRFFFAPDQHIVQRIVKDMVDHDLALYARSGVNDLRLDALVRAHVARVMKACRGNRTHAADLLGVNRRSLQRWFKGAHRPRASHQPYSHAPRRRRVARG